MACGCGAKTCVAGDRPHVFFKIDGVRYRARATGFSSARFGPCEVCGRACGEVFIRARLVDGSTTFGHAGCLGAEVAACPATSW